MFIGHYAVALAAKGAAPRTSLGVLFLAAQFVDLLWPVLLLLGLEHVRIDPGNTVLTPLDFYDYPITHSLLAAAGWSVLGGGLYFRLRRDARSALVVGACVGSHWILDALTHRPDLPLLPGGATRVGLGLWNHPGLSIALEGALFLAGAVLYLRATRPRDRVGRLALPGLLVLLALIWVGNMAGPPPPGETALAWVALAAVTFVFWAGWGDAHRDSTAPAARPPGTSPHQEAS